MQEYVDHDSQDLDTLSLSNFLIEDDEVDSKQINSKLNESTSSSSSSSLSEQDFLGFFTEELSKNITSHNFPSENIVFCGKVVSKSQTDTLFRSNSDSLRLVRLKPVSRTTASRSQSMPNKSLSLFPCKSRLMVFMFGSGSSKFPTKVDMSEIKSRQLRQQNSTMAGGKRGWWRVVDVLGCSGGYEKVTVETV
ncbi:hypothetical protein QVD17_36076 [Tagetes erecta]|uniref:Uncharacterized protein n=1 Tax=Tagetes erecta TaxID=13708 RepID=A0AAD8JRN6_TARER|nr:hypothetical protein QVD17_36076 [Tagetes erecta]